MPRLSRSSQCLGLVVLLLSGAVSADSVQLGPRPFYLVDQLPDGDLKQGLSQCAADTRVYQPSDFSIGHRGAPLQFPEHTVESYRAAARMGAGILECDVTFTRDKVLVCRHSQCDLHTTTNILETPLAAKCSEPFSPAEFDDGVRTRDASARCCTSDLTADEFLSLEGKMDYANPSANRIEDYIRGSAAFRTELYATGGTLLTHADSIDLFQSLGRKMTPELKQPLVDMPFDGMSQTDYAMALVAEYEDAGISPADVHLQSFHIDDVRTWVAERPEFGEQAILLEGRKVTELQSRPPTQRDFEALKAEGIHYLGPPIPVILRAGTNGEFKASIYADRAHRAGLKLIAWTTERSGRILDEVKTDNGAYYYDSLVDVLDGDGDILRAIDALATKAKVVGVFSDWPATTTFYANCIEHLSHAPVKTGPR